MSDRTGNVLLTEKAVERLDLKQNSFFAFAELRDNPLKWFDSIPKEKVSERSYRGVFEMSAQPGEYYVYQVGVCAIRSSVKNLKVVLTDLKDNHGNVIPEGTMTCFNTGGINSQGEPFTKEIQIEQGRLQPLWIGIDLQGVEIGSYSGSVSIIAEDEQQQIPIQLRVQGEVVSNHGYKNDDRLSRLNWLNSIKGINEEVTKGFMPIEIVDNKVSILARTLDISESGLPLSITSFFSPSNESFQEKGQPIVKKPFRFIIEKVDGEIIHLQPGSLNLIKHTPSKVVWSVLNTSKLCDLTVIGHMEFDGYVEYKLTISAKMPLKIKDIRLEIPVEKDKSEYMMGLGREGGLRPTDWHWKWDVQKNQDMLWVGAVNGGLGIKLKAKNYRRPLVNIYYEFSPLIMPLSWDNKGEGGIEMVETSGGINISAYSGSRELAPGEQLDFNFELLITPFKLIDKTKKYGDRYYANHLSKSFEKIKLAKQLGANIIDVHHAEDIYPFINYPYLEDCSEELTQLAKNVHDNNLRMKVYYTTRLLTKNAPEFWAFRSLNNEIIFPGPGNETRTEARYPNGPHQWYIENLREKYIPGWFVNVDGGKFKDELDLSIVTTPDSRLNNFYIAGLDWMLSNMDIDGAYIDDTALDRIALQRARKVIDSYKSNGRLDLHSWNHFHRWAGYSNSLNLYMDLLPYFDQLWIGEGRDYDRDPDHWLVEVSGIPFGLSSQMLKDGGNPWRGMVYGMTNRAGWKGSTPPTAIWQFWDTYKIQNKEMTGYWDRNNPITCNNKMIKASTYKGSTESIVSVANWSDKDQRIILNIDWDKLGLDPVKSDIFIPGIPDFQDQHMLVSLKDLTVPANKGFLIILKNRSEKI
ncbi:MAG: hypothetical protein DHS20C17_00770 [Cyclobacteriaceae bacterium]|nr:MAG: hypothetical protein DHS20C17_00770 [Cyclobacteriaceae bacterium]